MQKPKKGGDVKKAPPGFYLPGEARKRLGVTQAIFRAMTARGEIERIVPPGRSEGFYRVADINRLADQNALFDLQNMPDAKYAPVEFSRATEEDAQGIFNAVASLWGAENVTPLEIHRTLYHANPYISYVVKFRGLVLGYINATPYKPEVLEAIMEGRKRGTDLTAHDVLTYETGKSYDVYVGIVVRQDILRHEYYAQRLIFGFFGALCDLAREGIIIRRMYAISDQPRSVKMSKDLGFSETSPHRFVLDMETAESALVRKYREVVHKASEWPRRKPAPKKIAHDPRLVDALQNLLDMLTTSDIAEHDQVIAVLMPLIDQLAESPQMTSEQQALLRSIHEVLTDREINTPMAK